MSGSPSAFGDRRSGGSKAIAEMVYRPFLDLSCELIRSLSGDAGILGRPIGVVDVGVAQGFDPRLDLLGAMTTRLGFEPDAGEIAKLREAYAPEIAGGRVHLYNTALWSRTGQLTMYVTGDPDCSSFLAPNAEVIATLPDQSPMEIKGEHVLDVTALDEVPLASSDVDLIKVDVQGGELEVLKGARRILREQAVAVIVEVNFTELYSGQASVADLDRFLSEQGFALFDLDIRRWRRRPLPEAFAPYRVGQVTYADALYMKDIGQPGDRVFPVAPDRVKLLKLACLYEFFALPDMALEALAVGAKSGLLSADEAEHHAATVRANTVQNVYNRNIKPTP